MISYFPLYRVNLAFIACNFLRQKYKKINWQSFWWLEIYIKMHHSCRMNRVPPEWKIFSTFSQLIRGTSKLLQIEFRGIALRNGKYIKHFVLSILNVHAPWSCNGKCFCISGLAGENPHLRDQDSNYCSTIQFSMQVNTSKLFNPIRSDRRYYYICCFVCFIEEYKKNIWN